MIGMQEGESSNGAEGTDDDFHDAEILDEMTTSRGELKLRTKSYKEDRLYQVYLLTFLIHIPTFQIYVCRVHPYSNPSNINYIFGFYRFIQRIQEMAKSKIARIIWNGVYKLIHKITGWRAQLQ